jgi:hypothetical protein
MSKTTTLGEAQLTQSPNETITVELVQPDDMPPIVRIGWPLQPTVIDPERFRDLAAAMVKLFSEAHVTLTQIRARRYLS